METQAAVAMPPGMIEMMQELRRMSAQVVSSPPTHHQAAEVVREGVKITIPDGMKIRDAIKALEMREKSDEEKIALKFNIPGFPLEGMIAFQKAMERTYGWVEGQTTPGSFFSADKPVTMISVPTGHNTVTQVAWGRFGVPAIDGYLQTNIDFALNCFFIGGEIKAKHKMEIEQLAELTKKIMREESVYRGKSIRINWKWKRNEKPFNPERDCPQFINLTGVKDDDLILPEVSQRVLDVGLFTPIERTAACRAAGIPLKRGVLMEGPYGVGKSLTAHITASKANRNGWTYLYVENTEDIADAMKLARQYQPAVVFAEDIDQVMSGQRDISMDDILNTIDGVESKGCEIITVLTTNFVEKINPAMLRPGRLDAVVSLRPPDPQAVERLVRLYAGGMLEEDADLEAVGESLEGCIPAFVREAVERSKLASISRGADSIGTDDLLAAAESIKMHIKLMSGDNKRMYRPADHFAALIAQGVVFAMNSAESGSLRLNARDTENGGIGHELIAQAIESSDDEKAPF